MKLLTLGLVILNISLLSGVAEAVQVYHNDDGTELSVFGRIESRYMNNTLRNDENGALEGRGRIGISADSRITSNVKALAFAEWEVGVATSQNKKWNTRYAYTGFDFNQYGILVFGQGDTARYLAIGFTDVFEDLGSAANNYWLLGGRQEGQIMYSSSVGGYSFTASYQTAQKNLGKYFDHEHLNTIPLNVNAGYALGASYNWDKGALEGAAIAFGWDWYDLDKSILGDKHSFNVALSYGQLGSGLYTALLYSRDKFQYESHHVTDWEAVGGYTFENDLAFMLGIGYSGYDFDKTISSYATGQISYTFNTSMKLYAEGQVGLGHVDYPTKDTHQNSLYEIGLQYSF